MLPPQCLSVDWRGTAVLAARPRASAGPRLSCLARFAPGDWASATPGELAVSSDGSAGELKSISNFTRFYEDEVEGGELQTAVVSYFSQQKFPWSLFQVSQQVDLVAAVHIGDKEYFTTMQKELDSYDCVLYEMVADKGKDPMRNGKKIRWRPVKRKARRRKGINFNIISAIQKVMARTLSLDFQLECMDYGKDNWYNADLDYETFKALQRKKGESLLGFAAELTKISTAAAISAASVTRKDLDPWRMRLLWASRALPMPLLGLFIIEGLCIGSPLTASPELRALFNLDFGGAMKLFLAKQLSTELSDGAFSLLKNSVIIGERNRAAMEELDVALNIEGHERVAIFYGSGHLPDLDSRLRSIGFYPRYIRWQTAWSIKRREKVNSSSSAALAPRSSTGWPLNEYQTLSTVILSLIFAADLLFWEAFLSSLQQLAGQSVSAIAQFLDAGWSL